MIFLTKRTEIALVGVGGQGIILIGKILGNAAILEGKNALQTTEYTDAVRGGFSKSEVIIAEAEIKYPEVLEPDLVLALSKQAYDMYEGKDCLIIYDSSTITPGQASSKAKGFTITDAALKLNSIKVLNMISFGLIVSCLGIVSYESAALALRQNSPANFFELNLKAFKDGYNMGERSK